MFNQFNVSQNNYFGLKEYKNLVAANCKSDHLNHYCKFELNYFDSHNIKTICSCIKLV